MDKVSITIDGKKTAAEKGRYLLEIAREMNIDIPTLCYHPSLEPYGACRLCIVEVEKKGRKKVVTSCNYPAEDGLVVSTGSEKIKKLRSLLIELLLARCPESEEIKKLAADYGIKEPRFVRSDENCIMCGLCVRVCDEAAGVNAISFTGRGIERVVSTPFQKNSETCTGCSACVYVCPTGAVKTKDAEGLRDMDKWKTKLPLAKCIECGKLFAPLPQLKYLKEKFNVQDDVLYTCRECKRKSYGKKLISVARFHGG